VLDVVPPEKFYESILSRRPRIVVFDCDGTLWDGDTGSDFMNWSIETALVSRETVDWIKDRYRLYRKGEISEAGICGEMVQMYAGISEQKLRDAARSFFREKFEHRIFPEMLQLAEYLRAAGAELWTVSSTNAWVVEEGSSRFGIPSERVLAVRVRVDDQMITNHLIDVPTGEGKADSLRRVGISRPDVVFGNSVHDAPMLAMAAHAVAIHPSAELLARVERDGWSIHLPIVEPVSPR
jgi:HAD superfamily phosphoserine phosphatase-like hydrolase